MGAWAAPNSPAQNQNDIMQFLVMKVCVSATGAVLPQDPLHCPASQQRNIGPNEATPYYHADYPAVGDTSKCNRLGTNRRYAFPMPFQATDGRGGTYPLIAGWDNYPTGNCQWSQPNPADTVTFLTIQQGLSANIGGVNLGIYDLVAGSGYTNPQAQFVARFNRTWGFPSTVPPLGSIGSASLPKHTIQMTPAQLTAFPSHGQASALSNTIEWWTRERYVYGPASAPTRPLDTLLLIGFAQANATNDGPGVSTGSEHLYVTREFGYITRWEDWNRDDNPMIGGDPNAGGTLANVAYTNQNCGLPASIVGRISPHFTAGPVVNDPVHQYYSQVLTTYAKEGGPAETHTWYFVGCHDYTNVHPLAHPLALTATITLPGLEQIGGGTLAEARMFMQQFGATPQ
jgi:hypothetical protein